MCLGFPLSEEVRLTTWFLLPCCTQWFLPQCPYQVFSHIHTISILTQHPFLLFNFKSFCFTSVKQHSISNQNLSLSLSSHPLNPFKRDQRRSIKIALPFVVFLYRHNCPSNIRQLPIWGRFCWRSVLLVSAKIALWGG